MISTNYTTSTNPALKDSWANCGIWCGITLAVNALVHFLPLSLSVNGAESFETFLIYHPNAQSVHTTLLLPSLVLPIIFYVLTYLGYMNIEKNHSKDLPGVKRGRYGRPWILWGIVLVALVALWFWVVPAYLWAPMFGIDVNDAMSVANFEIETFGNFQNVVNFAAVSDILLFVVGVILFKPNKIMMFGN